MNSFRILFFVVSICEHQNQEQLLVISVLVPCTYIHSMSGDGDLCEPRRVSIPLILHVKHASGSYFEHGQVVINMHQHLEPSM